MSKLPLTQAPSVAQRRKSSGGAKLGAEKLTPEEQRRRFIEAAREAGASEDEADFDAALKRIARTKAGAKRA